MLICIRQIRTLFKYLIYLFLTISGRGLTHSHTFFFGPILFEWRNLFCTWRFIPPTHKTFASAHRSSVLESLILKNSIVLESVNHLLQMQSSAQCNLVYYRQNKILHDMIHMTIRIVLELVLVIFDRPSEFYLITNCSLSRLFNTICNVFYYNSLQIAFSACYQLLQIDINYYFVLSYIHDVS